jgi:modulator of FtsH protease HflC
MLRTMWEENRHSVIALGLLLLAILSIVIVVPETEQAVVVRLGDPDRVINRFIPNAPFGATGADRQAHPDSRHAAAGSALDRPVAARG